MKIIKNLSLNTLLLAVIALVATLSTALVQYQNYTTSLSNEINRVEQKHLLVAQNLSFALDRYLTDLSSLSAYLWQSFQSDNGWQQTAREVGILGMGVKSGANYRVSMLTNEAWTASLNDSEELSAFLQEGGEDIRFSGLINIGTQQVFVIAKSIDASHYFTLLPLDYIRDIQASIQFGDRGHSAIFDQHGTILAHPSAKLQAAGANLSKLSVVQQMMAGGTGVAFFYSPPMAADMVAGYTTLEKAGWGIMVPQPLMEIEQGVIDDISKGTLIGAVALIFFIFLGYLLSKRLTSSLSRNITDLKSISEGEELVLGERNDISRESLALSQALVTTAQQVRASKTRLSEALDAARENIHQQNQFIDHINHSIRTPLNGIAGAGELLDTDTSETEINEYREIILNSVTEITTILEEQFESRELVKQAQEV